MHDIQNLKHITQYSIFNYNRSTSILELSLLRQNRELVNKSLVQVSLKSVRLFNLRKQPSLLVSAGETSPAARRGERRLFGSLGIIRLRVICFYLADTQKRRKYCVVTDLLIVKNALYSSVNVFSMTVVIEDATPTPT